MKTTHLTLSLTLLILSSVLAMAAPLGNAFTYQGRLNNSGNPASGSYDLRFAVFEADAGSGQVGFTLTNLATEVSNGLFTVTLDFGDGVFTGEARWLEIGVRTNGGEEFTMLSPRQILTPSPYALHAVSADNVFNAGGATNLNADNISYGTVPMGHVASATNSVAGPAMTTDGKQRYWSFNGGLLTNLNASAIAGTVPLEQLPAAVLTNNAAGVNLSGTFTGITGFIPSNDGVGTNLSLYQTLHGQTASFTNAWPIALVQIDRGSLWLSPGMYGGTNEPEGLKSSWYGGSINWLGPNDSSANYIDGSYQSPLAKMQYFYDWGNDVGIYSPWLMITAPNIRFEEGWTGPNIGSVLIGNEGYVGNVFFNYQPVEWTGTITNGFGKPVTFEAVAIDSNTNRIYCYPGIMGRAIQTANDMPAPGGHAYGQGELYFYSATPLAAYGSMTTYPGRTNGIMHTNEWEFLTDVRTTGKFTGDGSGLSGISADAIMGGLTTNLVVRLEAGSTVTLCFTNGILRQIQ